MEEGQVPLSLCGGSCLYWGMPQWQRPSSEDGHTEKALLQKMKGLYTDIPMQLLEARTHVQELYREWLEGTTPSVSRKPCTPLTRAQGNPLTAETSSDEVRKTGRQACQLPEDGGADLCGNQRHLKKTAQLSFYCFDFSESSAPPICQPPLPSVQCGALFIMCMIEIF